jgi:hypothetical protein
VLASTIETGDNFFLSLREPTVLHSVRLGGQKQEAMAGHDDCISSGLYRGLGGQKQEVMAGDHDCSSSGLDNGLGGQKRGDGSRS